MGVYAPKLAAIMVNGSSGGELADQPRPGQAVAWGDSGIYRLHLPGIRICLRSTVYIVNIARVPGSG